MPGYCGTEKKIQKKQVRTPNAKHPVEKAPHKEPTTRVNLQLTQLIIIGSHIVVISNIKEEPNAGIHSPLQTEILFRRYIR